MWLKSARASDFSATVVQWATSSPMAKCILKPAVVNKVLLEHICSHSFTRVGGHFHAAVTELGSKLQQRPRGLKTYHIDCPDSLQNSSPASSWGNADCQESGMVLCHRAPLPAWPSGRLSAHWRVKQTARICRVCSREENFVQGYHSEDRVFCRSMAPRTLPVTIL